MRKILWLFAALACPGCAWTTENIDVPYHSAGPLAPVAGAETVILTVTGSDAREVYRDRVSSKKNGFGMEAAPIIATNDIVQAIRAGAEQELSARGFKVGPGAVQITLAVRRFYNDFKTGFFSADPVADFDVTIAVRNASGASIFSQSYFAQADVPGVQIMTGSNAQLALTQVMAEGVRKIVSDPAFIQALLDAQRAGRLQTS